MTLVPVSPPTEQPVIINTVLFGPPKTGKTTGAATAPGPIMYLNCEMPNATRFAHLTFGDKITEFRVEGLSTLIDVTHEIVNNPGKWGTVVIDPMHDFRRLILDQQTEYALRASLPIQGDVAKHVERFCRKMCELPINVVFVAHEAPMKDETTGVIDRVPQMGTGNPRPANELMGMVDIIAYTGVVEEEGHGVRYVGQLIPANGRRAGSRFQGALGKQQDLNIEHWLELINQQDGSTT